MSVDPGKTTGYVSILTTPTGFHLWEHGQTTITKRRAEHALAPYTRVAEGLMLRWLSLRWRAVKSGTPYASHYLIFEDFLLNYHNPSTKREVLSPVYITSAFEGLRLQAQSHYELNGFGQTELTDLKLSPPSSKRTITDDRLRRADLFIRGQPHARDAARHALLQVRRLHLPSKRLS